MADPTSDPVATSDAISHVVSTAGGGGFIATLLAFFQSRERAALRDRVTALEAEVAALRRDLDALAPRRLKKPQKRQRRA